MSEVMERTDDLVDRASIAAHQKKIATLRERAARAAEALRLEQSVHGTAEANYRAAVESGSADRYDLKSALDAAASRLVVESESHDAARAALAFHQSETEKVVAVAHKGMYEAGIRRRLAAAKEADRLKAALQAVASEYLAATEQMRQACGSGLPDIHGALAVGTLGFGTLVTHAVERRTWLDRRVSVDDPKHPWA
jgi:hypothetical protein